MLNLKNEFTSIMVTKVKILVSAIQNGLQWTQPFEEHAHGRTLFQMSLKRSLSPSISQLRCPVLRYTHNLISFFWQFTYKQIDMGRSRAQRAPYLKALKSKMRTERSFTGEDIGLWTRFSGTDISLGGTPWVTEGLSMIVHVVRCKLKIIIPLVIP